MASESAERAVCPRGQNGAGAKSSKLSESHRVSAIAVSLLWSRQALRSTSSARGDTWKWRTRWRSWGDRLADLPEVEHPHASGPIEHPAVSVILREARLPARGVSRLDQLELGAGGLKHRRRPRIGWRSA